jgi:glucosamine-6-phosphate deaminase
LKKAYLIDGKAESIPYLSEEIRKSPIDVGLIGIGENAHIAFNDPPADFDTIEAYRIVNLTDRCKRQQVREKWFNNVDEVPKQAVSMTVYQILQCNTIVSSVPYVVKAEAVRDTLYHDITNRVPATILKKHSDFNLFLDRKSVSLIDRDRINALGKEYSFTVL